MYNGILFVFDKSYHDSTNNENSSQSIIVFNVHSMLRDIEYGLGCRFIFYIMVLLKFHTICLYAKLTMSRLLMIFMFIVFRFNYDII